MKIRGFRRRAAAFLLGITVSAAQLLTGQAGTLAVHAETTQTTGGGQAMLVYLEDTPTLGQAMSGDAKALKAILASTNEFDEGGIQTFEMPQNSDVDRKSQLWERIHEMAENTNKDSFTVFTFSGHGNAALDGTSYLAAGGVNNITAAELRSHLDELQGRVLVIISCCFSGGMIMSASELDDVQESQESFSGKDFTEKFFSLEAEEEQNTSKTSASNDGGQASEEQDFVGNTVSDEGAQASGETAAGTDNPPQYYFITAANQWETSYSQTDIGTELISSFGHAMGYDRNNSDYHTFGADVSTAEDSRKWEGYAGDGVVTMGELAAYYKAECSLTSTPTIYPEESTDVLFTYGSDAGHPATFLAYLSQENVSVNAEGTIEITPILQNLTDRDIKLEAGVYDFAPRTFVYTTVSSGKYMDGEEMSDGYTAETGGAQEHIVKANDCVSDITFTFTADQFRDSTTDGSKNPFCLKIWECTDDGEKIGSYRALSFFTVPQDSQSAAIDASAFALKKPAQLRNKDIEISNTVTKTSSRLPMEIIYDEEDGDKYSSVPCLLSLYCYDFGTEFPEGVQARKDEEGYSDVLMDGDRNPIALNDYIKKTVFEDVRPTRERITEGSYSRRGGIHTYVMDTSGLTEGHCYVLQAICHDESTGKEKSIFALIQRTGAEGADEYQIPFFQLTNDVFEEFRDGNGIPIGENWTESCSEDQLDVKATGKRLQEAVQEAAGENYVVWVTDWKKQAATDSRESWESMQENERFSPGQKYLCTIEISVKEGSKAVFTDSTSFTLSRHSFESIKLSEDKKTARLTIAHEIPSKEFLEAMKLEMFRTDGKSVGEKVETGDTSLHPGDHVILVYENNLYYTNRKGLKNTGDSVTYNGDSYTVYEISELEDGAGKADLLFTVWKNSSDSCGCGQALYKWTVYPKTDDGKDTPSGGDSSGKDTSGDTTGGDGKGDDSSGSTIGGDGKGDNSSSDATDSNVTGGCSTSNAVEGNTTASGSPADGKNVVSAGENVTGGTGITDGSMTIVTASEALPRGENTAVITDTGDNSGTAQGTQTLARTKEALGADADERAANEESEEAVRKTEAASDGIIPENAEEVDVDADSMRGSGADEKTKDSDITTIDPMLRLYLVLIWILAVVLGIAIYRYLKRHRS